MRKFKRFTGHKILAGAFSSGLLLAVRLRALATPYNRSVYLTGAG
jgi:hypothetical protein